MILTARLHPGVSTVVMRSNELYWSGLITPVYSYTLSHSTRYLMVKTFANWPKAAKFAEVFTQEKFPLYGIIFNWTATFSFRGNSNSYLLPA